MKINFVVPNKLNKCKETQDQYGSNCNSAEPILFVFSTIKDVCHASLKNKYVHGHEDLMTVCKENLRSWHVWSEDLDKLCQKCLENIEKIDGEWRHR